MFLLFFSAQYNIVIITAKAVRGASKLIRPKVHYTVIALHFVEPAAANARSPTVR